MTATTAQQATVFGAIEALQRLSHAFQLRRRQIAAAEGLSESQWHILDRIARDDFIPSMFARQEESSAAAVSKTIRTLIDRELITVSLRDGDRRLRQYELTAEGRDLLTRLRQHRERAVARIWMDLPPAALEQFRQFSVELAERLEGYARSESAGASPRP